MAPLDFDATMRDDVVDHSGNKVDLKSFTGSGKVVGMYFSAHWCPPCKAFTPELGKFYTAMKAVNPNFEIVFISSDKDEDAFEEYFNSMPWIAVKYGSSKSNNISKHFGIQGIPSLIIVKGTGEVITKNGRGDVDSWKSNGSIPAWIK